MKTLALLFALSLLILPNPTHCRHNNNNPIRLPTASDTSVLDTDGAELQAGGVYSIISLEGGVRLVGSSDTPCPTDVILSNDSPADPIIITPADPKATLVLESAPLSFKFDISIPACKNKGSWDIQYDLKSGQQMVKTGDEVRALFKIEQVISLPDARIYKITYCVSDVCYNVSTFYDASIAATRLVLSRDSFLRVVFQKHTPPVLDTDGNQLLAGGVYNILSVDEPEGEVALVRLDNSTQCPSDVVLHSDNSSSGGEDRIMFSPSSGNPFVWESTYLSIYFTLLSPTPSCENSGTWVIQNDTKSGQQIVKTDLILGYPSRFKIERLPSESPLYKITYCPTTTLCYNVSTYNDTSVNAIRLALSNVSFVAFVFKKATTVVTAL